jgi:hypothetical protein
MRRAAQRNLSFFALALVTALAVSEIASHVGSLAGFSKMLHF